MILIRKKDLTIPGDGTIAWGNRVGLVRLTLLNMMLRGRATGKG
jgi:hypothetical protein